MVLDNEEEVRAHFLPDFISPSPSHHTQHREDGLVHHLGWQTGELSSQQKLMLGQAERSFYVMADTRTSTGPAVLMDQGNLCDNNATKVPDNLQVVKNILRDLESEGNMSDCCEGGESESYRGDLTLINYIEPLGETFDCEECSCGTPQEQLLPPSTLTTAPGTRGSLVVDVHHEIKHAGGSCNKHTAERFPRCYSESHQQSSRERGPLPLSWENNAEEVDQFHNMDKIEKVPRGDIVDRNRHFSESSARRSDRRKRAATLSSEMRQFQKSRLVAGDRSRRNTEEKEEDLEAQSVDIGSMSSLFSPVKFNIGDYGITDQGSRLGLSEALDEELKDQLENPPHPLVESLRTGVPCAPTVSPTYMSHSSSTTSMPICRICQLPSIEPNNPLISPCRCLGSIKYVHNPCLMKWLEVSSRKKSSPPDCELCQYQYIRHKKFVITNWLVPSCSSKDKVLHLVFMAAIATMITCSILTILCFKQNGDPQSMLGPNNKLSTSELMTLTCGVLFFLAFFVAMYVEVKAENTIYQLVCKFLYMNLEWTIEEYDRRRDPAKQANFP